MNSIASGLAERLGEFGQEHLLQFWDELTESQRKTLNAQIDEIDFAAIQQLYGQVDQGGWSDVASRAQPPPAFRLSDHSAAGFNNDQARQRGSQALSEGKVGMILVAGGQGSRLGFHHPKGMFPIGPVSQRTLFEILLDKVKACGDQHGAMVPVYVMTSPPTHNETLAYLETNHWFDYPRSHLQVFCQGTMPALDAERGKLLLSSKSELFLSPDGHGGMLAALDRAGGMADMSQRGIEQVFYCQVDNPLVQVCDPATIGWHILSQSEMSLQAVAKTRALQKVGNVVAIDGKVQIIEYSDLPEAIAVQTNDDGSLKLWAGSIAVHIFDLSFLKRIAQHAGALPFHLARKKVPYVDDQGRRVEPEQPNAIKFERFIFDLLPLAKKSFVVEVDPAEAFSPVKNADTEATETAATSRQSIINLARRQLSGLGIRVADGVAVEIHPVLANHPDRLRQRLDGIGEITEPIYLR